VFLTVPGAVRERERRMALAGKPHHDQTVKEHRRRGGPLDRPACPPLGLLKPQMALGLLEGDLPGPAAGVPSQDLDRRRPSCRTCGLFRPAI